MKVWCQKGRENDLQYKSEEQERKQKRSRAQNRQGRRRNKKKITVSEMVQKNHKIFLMITEKNKKRGGCLGKRNMVSQIH